MKNVLVAKVVVLDPSNRILLLRRSQTDSRRPGEWDLPGGGVEVGEDFAAAAIRETKEEAGLRINPDQLELLYTGTEFYEPKEENVHRCLFIARVLQEQTSEVILSFEHDEHRWATTSEVFADFNHHFYAVGIQYGLDHGFLSE